METLIHPNSYSDLAVFSKEKLAVFRKMWICVGLRRNLINHNDYITREVGGDDIIVQNLHGKICAFKNVCTHRFNRIHTNSKGNRQLRCDYHGWQFDADGLPSAIPKRPRFDDLNPAKLCTLSLKKVKVQLCGDLVFVCRDTNSTDLKTYLGDLYSEIEAMTQACGALLDENVMEINANWKILVENTLESYHVGFVHPETFGRLGLGDGCFSWHGPHSSWQAPVGKMGEKRVERLMPLLNSRPVKLPGYNHKYIFPNLTIASTYGATFSVQLIEPISAECTRFTSLVFQTVLGSESQAGEEVLCALGESAKRFNREVFQEDKIICEQVHLGSCESESPGILSDEELRVFRFQENYKTVMSADVC